MATENNCKGLRVLDPVEGLIDYINVVKPFHTKIVEVLVEYVYDVPLSITMLEGLYFDIEVIQPGAEQFSFSCQGGYSFVPWGGPRGWPIVSPNQDVLFQDYPAVDPAERTVILPGDRSEDLKPDDQFEIISNIDDREGLCRMIDLGPNHFIIENLSIHGALFTALFSPGDTAYTSGVHLDDERPFMITAILPDTPSVGLTRVEVSQNVLNPDPIGHFGLRKLPGAHTGTFTVDTITYSGGSIDFLLIPLDISTLRMGDDPHTIIKVLEPLAALPLLTAYQSHSMSMRLPPVEIDQVLSYSNFANLPTNTPDEGYILKDIVAAVESTLDLGGAAIPDTGKITVPGNLSESNIFVDEWVRISGSSENNGLFTITSLVYDSLNDETTLGVKERIRSDTADGTARIDVPANMFFLNGDHTHRFRQGVGFNIVGGSYQGSYMTLYSDFSNGYTRIRPAEEIIRTGIGADIVDVPSSNEVAIQRDRTATYVPGSNINITNSTSNDGFYEVVTSVYDPIDDDTTITVVEDILDLTVDGQVYPSAMGFVKETGIGYGETTDFCAFEPQSIMKVQFKEYFSIGEITLNLHNDLIAFNLENTDWWGIDTPIHTQYNAVAPTITEAAVAPGAPTTNQFWFNTDEGQLYYWSISDIWIPVKTVYWIDTGTYLFHYRTMYDRQNSTTIGDKTRVDTGWVQMFANPPGFSDVQPAEGTFNAHVTSFDSDPHRQSHNGVTANAQFYTIPGGNFVKRLGPETRLELYDKDGLGFLDFTYARELEILDIDTISNEITVPGFLGSFFETDTVLGVRIWNDMYHEMVVVNSVEIPPPDYGSVADPVTATEDYGSVAAAPTTFDDYGYIVDPAGETRIEVSATDINRFQGLTTTYGTVHGAVYDPRLSDKKTHVLPQGTLVHLDTDNISYSIVEPQKIHTLTTDAVIKENFQIDWGSMYAWKIVATDSGAGEITVYGDISTFLDTTNKMFITQSRGIDGEYEITSYVVNVSGPGPLDTETVITLNPAPPVDPPGGHLGFAQIEDSDVVDWFQFMIVSANSVTNEFTVVGDATSDIPNGGDFRVVGTLNDGTYTASAPTVYNGGLNQSTIQVASISVTDSGGWVEHV